MLLLLLGTLDSQVSLNSTGNAKNFVIKDKTGTLRYLTISNNYHYVLIKKIKINTVTFFSFRCTFWEMVSLSFHKRKFYF